MFILIAKDDLFMMFYIFSFKTSSLKKSTITTSQPLLFFKLI